MGTFVKTWLKWTNTGRFTLKWLLFAARLEISSKEYAEGPWGDNTPKVVDQLITTCHLWDIKANYLALLTFIKCMVQLLAYVNILANLATPTSIIHDAGLKCKIHLVCKIMSKMP